jgi:hypothetical protein
MPDTDPGPLLVVTVLLDASARPAAITRSHGDAMERALIATAGQPTAGLELAELAIAPKAFAHLKRGLAMPPGTVALYDIFPLAPSVPAPIRTIAGQFLAAEALWALEEQGLLGGVPPAERFDLPKGWTKDPTDIRKRLIEAGTSALSNQAVESYLSIKTRWDSRAPS